MNLGDEVFLQCRLERPNEREAIYRLQYQGFCEELKQVKPTPEMLKSQQWISSTDAYNTYVVLEDVKNGEIVGTISITPPNSPEFFFEKDHSLEKVIAASKDLVPGTPHRGNMCEARSLVIKKDYRMIGSLGYVLGLTGAVVAKEMFGAEYIVAKGHALTRAKSIERGYRSTGLEAQSGKVLYEIVIADINETIPNHWNYLNRQIVRRSNNSASQTEQPSTTSMWSVAKRYKPSSTHISASPSSSSSIPVSLPAHASAGRAVQLPKVSFFWSSRLSPLVIPVAATPLAKL